MAKFEKGSSMKQMNLIGIVKEGNEKGKYIAFQVDQSLKNPDKVREGKTQADTNPYLVSNEVEEKNGKYVSHDKFYQQSQIDKMMEAAKVTTVEMNGKERTVIGLKADVFPDKNEKGKPDFSNIVVNTKSDMSKTDNPRFGKTIIDKQASVNAAAKEHRAAEIKAKEAELNAELEADGVEKEAEDTMEL